ncbi:hypothetical protein B0H11DRAFT_2000650 [Mycena galericulata]|nr:hypothetical protein B0H11DRAFT_2000650 [Mycena galericulata]
MTDVHKNPDIDMTDESSKYEGLLAGPKEDTRIVLGWTLDEALKLQPPEVVDAVKADPESFLVAVLLSSSFRDRVRAPAIIKEIALNHGFDFPRVFGTITTGQGVKLPLPQPWGHFIPDCSPNTKKAALANPVMHGCIDEEFYTLYFIDPTTKQPPFLVLTYSGVSTLATETNLKEALLSKLRSDPFVTTMANADHSYVPNETKPEIILEILFHFAKIRKFNVTSNPSTEPTTAFSIILPPLSTDAAQTAELQHVTVSRTTRMIASSSTPTLTKSFTDKTLTPGPLGMHSTTNETTSPLPPQTTTAHTEVEEEGEPKVHMAEVMVVAEVVEIGAMALAMVLELVVVPIHAFKCF